MLHHNTTCAAPYGATCICPSTTHTVPLRGRVRRDAVDRTVPVLPSIHDWCLDAAALAAFVGDNAALAAHVGDAQLEAVCAGGDL